MTDASNDYDRAERIRQLQARRATPKRKHPAAATRWLLAGLSMASFFTIAGAVAVADQTTTSVPQPATQSTLPSPAVAQVPSPTTAAPATATPRPVTSTGAATPAAHTTTRGS